MFAIVCCYSLEYKLTFKVIKCSSGNSWIVTWTESWEGVFWTGMVQTVGWRVFKMPVELILCGTRGNWTCCAVWLKPFFSLSPGLSGAMASISVRSSTPGSPTHVSSGSNASRRRNGLHDVDLNTFISEEMALHLDNGGTRKRTSAQCGDVITDSPTHKRNRMI